MTRPACALALLAALATPPPARALALLEGETGSLTLGGYARMLAGVQEPSFELAPGFPDPGLPRHLGLSADVLRLEWKAALGDRLSAEVHQRVFLRMSSEPLGLGGGKLGLGASAAPRRSVNLRLVAFDEDRLLLEHDIDRLVVRASLGDLDVSAGRQAITWGVAELFPVADLWTTFSPFELDTSQKRGLDALRVLYSRSRDLELEAVLADRGSVRDLSGGLRAASYGAAADVYVALTKQWEELIALAGVSATAGRFKLRAEAAGPYDLDRGKLSPPRATLGADWMEPDLTVTLEGHYGGTVVLHPADYLAHAVGSPAISRGESYLLGRWYAGAAATWKLSELFQLSLSAIGNLQDPSLALSGAFAYQLSQETELSLGAYRGIGAKPLVGPETRFRSEMGSIGSLYYLALTSYF